MCSRAFIFKNQNEPSVTARNMDWSVRFATNLWAFQAGVNRRSMPDDRVGGLTWKSKFNSITAGVSIPIKKNNEKNQDKKVIVTTDGINTEGLVANLLWLNESEYLQNGIDGLENSSMIASPNDEGKRWISIGVWGQFMLDNYGSVKEAVEDWIVRRYKVHSFQIPPLRDGDMPSDKMVTIHLSLSDSRGDSAIFEIYRDTPNSIPTLHITTNISGLKGNDEISVDSVENCKVMTNSPVYSEQMQLYKYWNWNWSEAAVKNRRDANDSLQIHYLPGTYTSPDRFARVSHYLDRLMPSKGMELIWQAFSLMRVASVPLGYQNNPENPENSNTLWSTAADHGGKKYYYYSTNFPNIVWIDMKKLSFVNNTSALQLPIANAFEEGRDYIGDVSNEMENVQMDDYEFLLDWNRVTYDCSLTADIPL